jgi:apolipoprotein N-acyltransferase
MGRLRAVEHGRTVLVAATSGISAVIAPDGEVVDDAAVFTREVMVHEVPLRDDRTLATRLGVAPEAALAATGALALVLPVVRRRWAAA